jgi:hypothetical protein
MEGYVMQDLHAQREKLLTNAADCELIASLAADSKKRETFAKLAKDLKQLADDLGAEIVAREGKNAA